MVQQPQLNQPPIYEIGKWFSNHSCTNHQSTRLVNGSVTTVEPTTNLRDWWMAQQLQLNQPPIYEIGKWFSNFSWTTHLIYYLLYFNTMHHISLSIYSVCTIIVSKVSSKLSSNTSLATETALRDRRERTCELSGCDKRDARRFRPFCWLVPAPVVSLSQVGGADSSDIDCEIFLGPLEMICRVFLSSLDAKLTQASVTSLEWWQ